MDKESEHKGKAHKPAASHPWRNEASLKAKKWAKEQTGDGQTNTWRKGGGHKPWNGS